MNLIEEYNKRFEFFREITGEAMLVHRKYKPGLLESAYEAAIKYLLEQKGHKSPMVCSLILVLTIFIPSGIIDILIQERLKKLSYCKILF